MAADSKTSGGQAPLDRGRIHLRALEAFDWSGVGLPPFHAWDEPLASAARLCAFASAPMALMIGPRGTLVPNGATVKLFADAFEDLAGRSVLDLWEESRPFYAQVLDEGLRGAALRFEDQPIRVRRDGAQAVARFDLDFTPIVDRQGAVVAVLGHASEVTQRVGRMRALSESEQRLRLALDGSGMVGIWTLDVARNLSTADANVARIFGLSEPEGIEGVEDQRFFGAIHPDDRDRVAATLRSAIQRREPYRCRYRVPAPDGRDRWVVTSAKPAFDDEGRLERLLGVVVDITDQMETAAALAESRFQFETLTEALPQIVWSCDAEGRHDYFSTRWREFTGIAPEEITEDTWKKLVDPRDWPTVSDVWANAMRTGETYDLDYRFRHHSGEYRWLRVMALPIRDPDGHIARWFGTSTDVHETYQIASEREAIARELERIATEDQLTAVLTRRAFLSRADALIDASAAQGRPVSVLMLDIDHFKSINDTYGHSGGDKVLAAAARRLKSALKKQDLVGRLGGEEFAVLLPECPATRAKAVAERIRRAVEATPISTDDRQAVTVTVSVGVTTAVSASEELDRLLVIADKALYQAKGTGRNRSIFLANEPQPSVN